MRKQWLGVSIFKKVCSFEETMSICDEFLEQSKKKTGIPYSLLFLAKPGQKLRIILLLLLEGNSVASYKLSWFSPLATLVTRHAPEPTCQGQIISLQNSPVQEFVKLESVNIIEILRRLSKEPNAALSFFNDTKNCGCFPDVDSYTTMIQILCSSNLHVKLKSFLGEMVSSKEKLGFEIVSIFDCLLRRYKGSGVLVRVLEILLKVYIDFGMYKEAISTFFQSRSISVLPHERPFNFILNSLIDHGMSEMAMPFFQELKRFGLNPNIYSFTILTKLLCKERKWEEVNNVFQQMQQLDIKPDIYTYTTLMKGMCSSGKSGWANELLQNIRGSGVQFGTFSYNVVISGFCCEMRLQEAEAVLEDMRKQGVAADAFSYSCIIHGYCKSGDLSRALSHYEKLVAEDSRLLPDKVLYGIVIDAHCRLKNMRKAIELFNKMKDGGLVPDVIHYTSVMNGYFHLGEFSGALAVFSSMLKIGITPDIVTCNVLAGLYCRNGYRQESLHLLENLTHMLDHGLSSFPTKETKVLSHLPTHEVNLLNPNSITCGTVIEGFCEGGKVEEAEQLFTTLMQKGFLQCVVTSSAMVKGYCKADCTTEAYKLFVNLCKQNICVDQTACSKLISCLCKKGNVEKAFKVFKKMLALGVIPNELSYSILLGGFTRAQNMSMAWKIYEDLVKRGFSPDVITYTALIHGLCKMKCFKEASDLFNEMKTKGIKPDVVTYTVLLDAQFKEKFKEGIYYSGTHEGTKQKGSEACSAIFELLTEMIEKEIEPDVACFTALIDGYFKMNCVNDAVNIFNDMTSRGLKPDVVAYTALVSGYCKQGKEAKAWDLVNEMRARGIHLDDHILSFLEQGIMRAKQI